MKRFFSRFLGLALLLATATAFAQSQAGSAGLNFPVAATPCPKTVEGYTAGQTYASAVKRCLGVPAHEDHNPDGHFVYIYNLPEGQMTAFLFDSGSLLVRTRSYGHKVEKPTSLAPHWAQLRHHFHGNTSFVDLANSKREGKMYRTWVMTNYAKAFDGTRSVKIEETLDCESETWSPLSMISYSAPNGQGKTLKSLDLSPGNNAPFPIIRGSGSVDEDVREVLCEGSK